MHVDLGGLTALITGSTRGIGQAAARHLARCGARVAVNGREAATVAAAAVALRQAVPGATFLEAPGDVATREGCDAVVAALPAVDILVSNASFYQWIGFFETTDEDWLRFLQMNLMAGVRLARAYMPGMLERDWGRVVFTASEAGVNIPKDMIHYGVAKAAEIAAARGLAELTAGTGVTVNSVLPGPTASSNADAYLDDYAERTGVMRERAEAHMVASFRPTSLLRRMATEDEVANMILYVCSRESAATNGAAMRVEGGILRHPA